MLITWCLPSNLSWIGSMQYVIVYEQSIIMIVVSSSSWNFSLILNWLVRSNIINHIHMQQTISSNSLNWTIKWQIRNK